MSLNINERSWNHYLKHKAVKFQRISVDKVNAYVVIPSFAEGYPLAALESLANCDVGTYKVEVIVVMNIPQDATYEERHNHKKTIEGLKTFNPPGWMNLSVMDIGVVRRRGAGKPRKWGTDLAITKAYLTQNLHVPVLWLDADTSVSKNYILEGIGTLGTADIIQYLFKHRVSDANLDLKEKIAKYESRLRYHRWAMRLSGIPWCPYYIGSCMGFTANAYVWGGGISASYQAGEDFYLMHKIIKLGRYEEITRSTVYPEARISKRVPYGTGPALAGKNLDYYYSLDNYKQVGKWLRQLISAYPLDYNEQPLWVRESISRWKWLNWVRISKTRLEFVRHMCGLPIFKMIRRSGNLSLIETEKSQLESILGMPLDQADILYPLRLEGSSITELLRFSG